MKLQPTFNIPTSKLDDYAQALGKSPTDPMPDDQYIVGYFQELIKEHLISRVTMKASSQAARTRKQAADTGVT